ncbi:MAG: FGGY-family carbohydrate kinase [Alphaproteobacteria bacterium]
MPPYLLAIDVGTGSGRVALVNMEGGLECIAARGYPTRTPRPGWSEQRPADWWDAVRAGTHQVLHDTGVAPEAIAGLAVCGQMHGPVPIGRDDESLLEHVQLWNDKRAEAICESFRLGEDEDALRPRTGNPVAPSWVGFKVAWIARHQPDIYERARAFLVPKDYLNLRLTGVAATDYSEASGSYVLDCESRRYDPDLAARLGVEADKFASPRSSTYVIGTVTTAAAEATGLAAGTPVVAGGGDFLVSLLGAGAARPGTGADVTGTSNLVSVFAPRPIIDGRIQNLHAADVRGWVPFGLIDAGGGALRWARRTFGPELDYAAIDEAASAAGPGAEGLLFLPYLTGERLGGASNSRAQLFGLTERHDLGHVWRAVLEGVALASRRNVEVMRGAGAAFDRIIATGGGANSALWLRIKAAAYRLPVATPREVESGLIGCAILAGCGAGLFDDTASAVEGMVSIGEPVHPDAQWAARYDELAAVFDRLREQAAEHFDRLDHLSS